MGIWEERENGNEDKGKMDRTDRKRKWERKEMWGGEREVERKGKCGCLGERECKIKGYVGRKGIDGIGNSEMQYGKKGKLGIKENWGKLNVGINGRKGEMGKGKGYNKYRENHSLQSYYRL